MAVLVAFIYGAYLVADFYVKLREWIEKFHKYTTDLPVPALLAKRFRTYARSARADRMPQAAQPALVASNDVDINMEPDPDPDGRGNGGGRPMVWHQVTRRHRDGWNVNWMVGVRTINDLLARLRLVLKNKKRRVLYGLGLAMGRLVALTLSTQAGANALAAAVADPHGLLPARADLLDRNGYALARAIDAWSEADADPLHADYVIAGDWFAAEPVAADLSASWERWLAVGCVWLRGERRDQWIIGMNGVDWTALGDGKGKGAADAGKLCALEYKPLEAVAVMFTTASATAPETHIVIRFAAVHSFSLMQGRPA